MRQKIGVVGGGIIGLGTVEAILEDFDAEVTVYASDFTPNTTGNISAGFIYPYQYGECDEKDLLRWTNNTIKHLAKIRRENGEPATGISPISGYVFWKKRPAVPLFMEAFYGFREVGRDEIMQVVNGDPYFGAWFFTTWSCSCDVYLAYLMKKLKQKGVRFIKETISSLNDLADRGFDVVVNCAGFGAQQLTGDREMTPIQGQVLQVKAPWVQHFFIEGDGDCYLLPKIDSLVVGGTHKNDVGLCVNKDDSVKIWADATRLLPCLDRAVLMGEHIGIRPGRTKIRIEVEDVCTDRGKRYTLLHHYGHGGAGVTLHRGCATEASELLKNHLCLRANL